MNPLIRDCNYLYALLKNKVEGIVCCLKLYIIAIFY